MTYHSLKKSGSQILSFLTFVSVFGILCVGALVATSQPARAIPASAHPYAIPAFARKYGLPCSACHEAWPKLNNFGQVFKDSGYQLGNERDTPITQSPTYWPITLRITPNWHRESTDRVAVDNPSVPAGQVEQRVTTHGFDLSGMDILTGGTLAKNISFLLVPSADNTGAFHFESVWVRFNNLLGSRWLNVKFGKFELDNVISEKRIYFLSDNGGSYQLYHFVPVGETSNPFGLGDNQLGVELMGHSPNSYTRYSLALLSSNDGNVGLPSSRGYDGFATFSQAFELGRLGLQRVGVFGYVGRAPTIFPTSGGTMISGAGVGNKSFYRAGAFGIWYVGKVDFSTLYMRGSENVFLGTNTPADQPLPLGARGPAWNGGFIETHFTASPQLVLFHRYELIRMSRQALPTNPGNLGDIDALSFGYRWYPFMHSRAGLAWHNEYSIVRSRATAPLSGRDTLGNSVFLGLDFDF